MGPCEDRTGQGGIHLLRKVRTDSGELVEGGLLAQVQERLISRKLWVSVVTGLAVAFQPDLSPEVKAQLVAGVGVGWFVAQGAGDLFRGPMGPAAECS